MLPVEDKRPIRVLYGSIKKINANGGYFTCVYKF
jgi:hypothetical protein